VILYKLLSGSGYRPLARMLYRMEIAGTERIPKSGPCILVANHESVIDPWVLALATPRSIHYMAKAELWENARAHGDGGLRCLPSSAGAATGRP
jgi:1-acyl-sn-glycerol-3-phosphate acyltransferase